MESSKLSLREIPRETSLEKLASFKRFSKRILAESADLITLDLLLEPWTYYELRCADCGARLSFGSMKKGGGLFPRRKDSEGNWLPDRGWVKWNPKTEKNE
jgi:hypothetical protein